MSKWVFINGVMLPESDAVLPIRDLAIQRGYGIFDFFKVVNGQPVFLDDHLHRFYFSAEAMRLPVLYEREQLKAILSDLLEKNACDNTGVRLTLTGGYSPDGYQLASPNLVIETRVFTEPTNEQLHKGIRLMSFEHQRQLPQVKTIDYLMAIWLQETLRENGADDVLYHQNGWVTECPRSNFFVVHHDGTIVTPRTNILNGVMRKKLIQLSTGNYPVEERDLSLPEVKTAKEAFITSTTKTILPVSGIDNYSFPGDGNFTQTLRRALLQVSGGPR